MPLVAMADKTGGNPDWYQTHQTKELIRIENPFNKPEIRNCAESHREDHKKHVRKENPQDYRYGAGDQRNRQHVVEKFIPSVEKIGQHPETDPPKCEKGDDRYGQVRKYRGEEQKGRTAQDKYISQFAEH